MAQYGARSKTTNNNNKGRNSGANRNHSSVNSSNDDGWGKLPRTSRAAHTFNSFWDNIPSNPAPIENAWEQDREVHGWSNRNRKFHRDCDNSKIRVQQERPAWRDIESEFPALESKPVVNVWKVREEKFQSKKAMEPTSENEEERMIRQAMQLSKIEAKRDEQRRLELAEEYKLQMHMMETNPLLFGEFRTDEELAAALSDMNTDFPTEENLYDDRYFPTEEEDYSKKKASRKPGNGDRYGGQTKEGLQNANQQDLAISSNNATTRASRKTISDSENKTKITNVVNMFGGWGQLDKNSQKPVRVESGHNINAKPPSKLPAENSLEKNETTWKQTTQNKANSSQVRGNNTGKENGNRMSDKSDSRLKGRVNSSSVEYNSSEDFGWQSDTGVSELGRHSKDKDGAWKTEDPVPSPKQENCAKMKTEQKYHSEWQSDTGVSEFETESKDDDSVWKTENSAQSPRPIKTKANDKYQSGWQSDTDVSELEMKSRDEDWAWKSNDTVSSSRQENSIETKTEKNYHSVKQKHSMNPISDTSTRNGELAKSIVSEYVDLASKCESSSPGSYQNAETLMYDRKLPASGNVFDVLHEDYVNGTSQSRNSQSDPIRISSPQSLSNKAPIIDDSSKLQFTNSKITNDMNEISYSLKSVPKDISNENDLHGSASLTSDPLLPTTEDNDISLPLFAPSQSHANNFSSTLPSFPSSNSGFSSSSNAPMSLNHPPALGPFPESLQAHFQQFQPHPVPMTPAFTMNPGFMMNQLIMMQQMMPVAPGLMNNFYKSMGGGLPMFNQPMLGVPSYLPFANFTGSPPASAESSIAPPIPPPSQRSDLEIANVISQFEPSPEDSSATTHSGNDEWLDRFLSKESQAPIPPPMMPQNGTLGGNAMNFPPEIVAATKNFPVGGTVLTKPTLADDSGWLDDGDTGFPNASNDDWEAEISKSMRNSSRYVAERNKENRQPASRPSFARGFRNGS